MRQQPENRNESTLFLFWQRLPVIVRAIITGGLMAAAGTLPWAFLVSLNIRYYPEIPWAVLPTALYLWLFWKYAGGAWWPQSTAATRRELLRAKPLSGDVWGAAIMAGIIGLVTVLLFLNVLNRMVNLPVQRMDELSNVPTFSLLFWLLMSAAVAGITEEAAFRGYMQVPIERRHGPLVAILVTGALFGFAHFSHPEVTMMLMPYYMAVAAVYGMIAFLTKSIYPGMLLHAGGNILVGIDLVTRGQSEWQSSSTPKPLVWETGADTYFYLSIAGVLILGAVTVWAFNNLASVSRTSIVSVEENTHKA